MLEYAGSQRAGLRGEREAPALLSVVRSLDWVLLLSVAALVIVGLWGVAGITKFVVPHDPNYYLNRQILYASVGGVVLVVAALVDPDMYRRYWRAIFIGTSVVIAFVRLVLAVLPALLRIFYGPTVADAESLSEDVSDDTAEPVRTG